MEQWGTVTEIDWRTLKIFDLSKARVRVVMKERSVLPALIEVVDGSWDFTVSITVVGKEVGMQDRKMADSLMEWREGQKAGNAPGRTRGMKWTEEGNSWPPMSFNSKFKSLEAGGVGPKQEGKVKAQSNPMDEIWVSKHLSRAQYLVSPGLSQKVMPGWKREAPRRGPIQQLGQESGGQQNRSRQGPTHRASLAAKGKAKVGYDDSELQRREPTVMRGSKKLWNVLLPSSSESRQGDRSREKPVTAERSPSGSDSLSVEEVAEVGSILLQGGPEEGMKPSEEIEEQRNTPRVPFMSKEKERMRNNVIGEDGEGGKGFAGYSHSGSSVADHPSYHENREKGLIGGGTAD
ncbi:hypothetical protein CK203_050347 [Vitis vinifera]|uniref:DUF4283 domain-containing protein n=1 Tax=Vitis vinifera TaxID=29760 RepID=A0A438H026_VITVI|nr:hypothetical protein CK203_050347 [Vitis vinifera]